MLRALAILAIGLSAGACATITTGTTQAINVDSDPAGAECALMRGGATLSTVTTPSPVTVKRDAQTIHVRCKKDGYEEALVVMNSRFEGASVGNVLLGGIVGVMIDASSGANAKYDPYVMVRMTALSAADRAAVAARPRPAPAETPRAVAATTAAAPAPAAVPSGRFDGTYGGGVAIGFANAGWGIGLRQIEVTVTNGDAVGTVRHAQCAQPGEMKLTVDQGGAVSGVADMLTGATCGAQRATIEGRAENGRLLLTAQFEGKTVEFSLNRR